MTHDTRPRRRTGERVRRPLAVRRVTSRCVTARTVRGRTRKQHAALARRARRRVAASGAPAPRRKTMMFVCTRSRSSAHAGAGGQPLAMPARCAWSSASRVDMVVERVELPLRRGCPPGASRRRACAGSATRAAIIVARCRQHRAARRAQALRQRDRDEIERRGELGRGGAARDRRVPKPRAVEKGCDATLARGRADALDLVLVDDDAAGTIVRVLDLDQRRRRIDRMAARLASRRVTRRR